MYVSIRAARNVALASRPPAAASRGHTVGRQVQVRSVVDIRPVEVRQQEHLHAPLLLTCGIGVPAVVVIPIDTHPIGWEHAMRLVIIVKSEPDLLEIVLALRAASRLAGHLNSRQQKGNQNGNNRNDDKKLDKRESGHTSCVRHVLTSQDPNNLSARLSARAHIQPIPMTPQPDVTKLAIFDQMHLLSLPKRTCQMTTKITLFERMPTLPAKFYRQYRGCQEVSFLVVSEACIAHPLQALVALHGFWFLLALPQQFFFVASSWNGAAPSCHSFSVLAGF
ncbi:MAG: hypothetical protein KatS3mg027_0004 [Bacteroidia bacterium]|nr:MAG: hypothetical protein KatS3mg027_0004 [Bacteroidia bacterium]